MAATMQKTIGARPPAAAVPAREPTDTDPGEPGQPADPGDRGRVYTFEKMPARAATRVQVRVAKVAAEPFAAAFAASMAAGGMTEALQAATMFRLLKEILSKMDEDDLISVQELVFASVMVEGKKIDLDATFADRPEELWEVLVEELRWTFESFFRGSLFASKFKSLMTIASRQSSPPTSTPPGTSPSPMIPPSAP